MTAITGAGTLIQTAAILTIHVQLFYRLSYAVKSSSTLWINFFVLEMNMKENVWNEF
jgi:hypothetical protein